MRIGSLVLPLLIGLSAGGCYSQIIDAVVDDETDPGGMLSVQIDDGAPVVQPALAQGSPLTITSQTQGVVIAFTCQSDANGLSAATVLANAGAQIQLAILPMNGNQLQVHAGGQSSVADGGTISLTTNTDGSISGTFDTTGHVEGTSTSVILKGTLSEIPLAK